MREIITIGIGAGGALLAQSHWEALVEENKLNSDEYSKPISSAYYLPSEKQAMFNCLLIDDGQLLQKYRSEPFGKALCLDSYVSLSQRGQTNSKEKAVQTILETIRKRAETCDSIEGVSILHHSSQSLSTAFMQTFLPSLRDTLEHQIIACYPLLPANTLFHSSDGICNTALTCQALINHADVVFPLDYQAIYNKYNRLRKKAPTSYEEISDFLPRMMSDLTCHHRCNQGPHLNSTLRSLTANLVPFPIQKFVVGASSHLFPQKFELYRPFTTSDMTQEVFSSHNQFLAIDPRHGRNLVMQATYRGAPSESYFEEFSQHRCGKVWSYFVEWIPGNFQRKYSPEKVPRFPGVITTLANTTATIERLSQIRQKMQLWVDNPANQAAKVRYFEQGIDQLQMGEASSILQDIISSYQQHQDFALDDSGQYDEEQG